MHNAFSIFYNENYDIMTEDFNWNEGGNIWATTSESNISFAKPRKRRQLSRAMIQEEITSNLRMKMVGWPLFTVWAQRRSTSSSYEGLAYIKPTSQ